MAAVFSRVLCNKLFSCCTSSELMKQFQIWGSMPADIDSCVDLFAPSFESNIGLDSSLSADGRLKYQPEYAAECANTLAHQTCLEWSPEVGTLGYSSPVPACVAVLQGALAVGDDCSGGGDELCESGYCDLIDGRPTCDAAAHQGEACQRDSGVNLCRAGLVCDVRSTDWTCQPKPRSTCVGL
jgi:hypothetical protein